MKEELQQAKNVMIVELCTLPLFLITYTEDRLFFWIILLLLDSYLIKHLNIVEISMMIKEQKMEELRPIMVLSMGVFVGYIIICIKNLPLGLSLIVNDIIMDLVSFYMYMNKENKK